MKKRIKKEMWLVDVITMLFFYLVLFMLIGGFVFSQLKIIMRG